MINLKLLITIQMLRLSRDPLTQFSFLWQRAFHHVAVAGVWQTETEKNKKDTACKWQQLHCASCDTDIPSMLVIGSYHISVKCGMKQHIVSVRKQQMGRGGAAVLEWQHVWRIRDMFWGVFFALYDGLNWVRQLYFPSSSSDDAQVDEDANYSYKTHLESRAFLWYLLGVCVDPVCVCVWEQRFHTTRECPHAGEMKNNHV